MTVNDGSNPLFGGNTSLADAGEQLNFTDMARERASFFGQHPGFGRLIDTVTSTGSAITGIARGFGLHLVAEGVERQEQADRLQDMGCDIMQGHYFCEAVCADTAEQWLTDAERLLPRPAPASRQPGAT